MSWTWTFNDSEQPKWAVDLENRINRKLGKIMSFVSVEQSELDDLDASLDDVAASLAAKIQALIDAVPAPLPPAELSALQADVENLRALGAPAPVEPPAEPTE